MTEAERLPWDEQLARDRLGARAVGHLRLRVLQEQRALLGRAEDDRATPEDPRCDGPMQ